MATRSVQRRSTARAGDLTGKMKEQQIADNEAELAKRQNEVTMHTKIRDDEMDRGVFDPQTQRRLDGRPNDSDFEENADEGLGDDPFVTDGADPFNGPLFPGELVLTGQEPPEVKAQLLAQEDERAQRSRREGRAGRVLSAFVTIRTNETIEKMTYGMRNGEPNNYDFEAGRPYRVPRDVAQHLDQLALIGQWVTR